ncbi:hypothetical protein ACJX0J_038852, partial [Zea mays]
LELRYTRECGLITLAYPDGMLISLSRIFVEMAYHRIISVKQGTLAMVYGTTIIARFWFSFIKWDDDNGRWILLHMVSTASIIRAAGDVLE